MTQRAYYTSDDLSLNTQVLSCKPMDDGRFEVVLVETLFHPQGGGQLADQGFIAGVRVEGLSQVDGQVVHVVGQQIAVGSVEIEVLMEPRNLNARLHSAGHLISGVGQIMGWNPTKGHHWPGECRVVFERQAISEPLTAEALAEAVNALIDQDVPRHLVNQDGVRSVCFGSLPMHGCGGTHVASAGMVGRINVIKIKEKKGLLSVHYDLVD
ncbi:alanyl-tRNA editing protein [Pseudomonas syringae pv. dysoxyli]|uniref:alanyl-tRNA editing protein n=1 Tax=Pseudomonas syringae TaxID=317 RepID=UPI001372FE30|nr:alanyl-tRNA editing protein [Pseudomonas syringae]NAO28807.1 alanyl-tRNA editing protein [Pseudomonas syringae pv. dysoxyli]